MGLYMVQSFTGASFFVKLALIFLLFGMLMGWIAFTTANWCRTFPTADDNYYKGYGVWRIADNSEPNATLLAEHTEGWLLVWFGFFQMFAIFGFIGLNVAFLLIVLFVFVGPCKSKPRLCFWNAINCIATGICWLLAIIIFEGYYKSFDVDFPFDEPRLSYSFHLAASTCSLQLAAGYVLLRNNGGGGSVGQQKPPKQHKQQKEKKKLKRLLIKMLKGLYDIFFDCDFPDAECILPGHPSVRETEEEDNMGGGE